MACILGDTAMVRLLFILAFVCAVPFSRAGAQEILALDYFSGELYRIDPQSGVSTLSGSTGLSQNLWTAMAKNSQGQIFAAYGFWNVANEIYEIIPSTGQAILVAQTSLFSIRGMAFDDHDALFLVNDRDAPTGPGRDDLWSLELATGTLTLVGSTGLTGLQALAFGQGTLWGYDVGPVGLVRIDPLTGIGVDVNPLVSGTYSLCQTLAFSDEEVLYAAYGALWIIDTVTGVPGYVADIYAPGIVGAMEFLPNQPAPFSLGVQGKTGSPMSAFASGATPGSLVGMFGAIGVGGVSTLPGGHPCAGTLLDLNSVHLIMTARAGPLGRVQFGQVLVPIEARGHVEIQAVDQASCTTSNPVTIFF